MQHPQRSSLQNWESTVNQRLPGYKFYPLLFFIRLLIAVLGWVLVFAGIIAVILTISSGIATLPRLFNAETDLEAMIGLIGSAVAFISSLFMPLAGIVMIAASETIKLLMDLQENADRQSMYLLMLYNRERSSHE